VPKELRTFQYQETATGSVVATAKDLMPSWSLLEVAVRPLQPDNPAQARHVLQVSYYTPPPLQFTLENTMTIRIGEVTMHASLHARLRFKPPAGRAAGPGGYQADGRLVYDSFTVSDPYRCTHVLGYRGSDAAATIPLGTPDGRLALDLRAGAPTERLLEDCPDDDAPPVRGDAKMWFTCWFTVHPLDPLSGQFRLSDWQGSLDGGGLSIESSGQGAPTAGSSCTEQTSFRLTVPAS